MIAPKTVLIESPAKEERSFPLVALIITGIFVLLAALGSPKKPNPFNSLYYHIVNDDVQSAGVSKIN